MTVLDATRGLRYVQEKDHQGEGRVGVGAWLCRQDRAPARHGNHLVDKGEHVCPRSAAACTMLFAGALVPSFRCLLPFFIFSWFPFFLSSFPPLFFHSYLLPRPSILLMLLSSFPCIYYPLLVRWAEGQTNAPKKVARQTNQASCDTGLEGWSHLGTSRTYPFNAIHRVSMVASALALLHDACFSSSVGTRVQG